MPKYPLHIAVRQYIGNNQKKKLKFIDEIEIARKIKLYFDEQMSEIAEGDVAEFDYYEISEAIQVEKAIVRKLLFRSGGGSNGITLGK